jgi:4-aminobutyrate aminotransferase-like enzyme
MAPFPFDDVTLSLVELAGEAYVDAVCAARAVLTGEDTETLQRVAREPVALYPAAVHARQLSLLARVGETVCAGLPASAVGATTRAFAAATHREMAPLSAAGPFRVGEDGRLYLIAKSEHYHTPLGHSFPGYRLLETARRLGIPNATHNNTRGHLTRLLEERLLAAANGAAAGPLDGVLNLETGSLAVEAAMKMMLARFFQVQAEAPVPRFHGRIPVMLVMGNDAGGLPANYHGTTVLTQCLRGMWPEVTAALGTQGLLRVCPIRPNAREDLSRAFAEFERPPYKIAGFLHEIVMMNYGARVLEPAFLRHAYSLCAAHDVPTLVDEIQSCLWAPTDGFLFREYGLQPDFVAVGKGFPGGEYPASRLLFRAAYDCLPQFGALVTNGQEEVAALAYLVTMHWARANADRTRAIGDQYEARLHALAADYPAIIMAVPGQRHLTALAFHDLPGARAFVRHMAARGLDVSVQTYKADCPPVVLTKLPLIACPTVVDFVLLRMHEALAEVAAAAGAG